MGDLSETESELNTHHTEWFESMDKTPMVKSYKMVTLLAMLNEDAFSGLHCHC